jgi:putative ABC transport system ATP-binding protein
LKDRSEDMDDKQTVIRVISLFKEHRVGDSVIEALKDINLEISEGEFLCIEGPSGAGKTTILNLIGGLDRPTSGDIRAFGHDLNNYGEDFLAVFRCVYVGFVFQSYNLISTLTASENVEFALELAGFSDERVKERPMKLLAEVGLSHRADHFPSQLSGGEQQRVAFARALANDPPLMLVDEPTANLDENTAIEIAEILGKLKRSGKTVVVATHDTKIIELADRVLHLRNGRIIK